LAQLPSLRCLHLCLDNVLLGDRTCAALSCLANLNGVTDFDVSIRHNQVTWLGISHLCQLGNAARLSTLRLAFCGNLVGDIGVGTLSTLRWRSTGLRHLCVEAADAGIGDAGIRNLSFVAHAPNLRTLRLQLMDNTITDTGAMELCSVLSEAPTSSVLNSLEVDLTGNACSSLMLHHLGASVSALGFHKSLILG
jgi:hypothetical protein